MRMRTWAPLALLATAGCLPKWPEEMPAVRPGTYNPAPTFQPTSRASHTPAPEEVATRVNLLGQKLLAANPQCGLHPVIFHTVGVPQAEVFHRGTSEVFITEGMVRECKSDGTLAAVLALELGKMVAERETLAAPEAREPEKLPPQEMRVGADFGGAFGPPDGTRRAEMLKYDRERRKPGTRPTPPPDSARLAVGYLERAGYATSELQMAQTILGKSHNDGKVQKQLLGTTTSRPWAK